MLIPAVGYCRVSSNSDDQKRSYDAQIKDFRENAKKLGYELVQGIGTFGDGIYADRGLSGKALDKIPELNRMFKEAEKGQFEAILVSNVSRFARNAAQGMDKIRDLKKYNVYLHFITQNIKSCNHSDEFLIDFFLVFAQNELREMSRKIQSGIRKAQNSGVWTSQPPYGYDKINGYLKINNKEAENVKNIFDMYVNQKMSINKISQYLNENNITTKKGKMWQHTTLRHILTNLIYTGKQIGHQREMDDIFANEIRITDEDEWIENNIEAIIDKETFQAAQNELNYRKEFFEHKKKYSSVNILSNIFYCECGSAMKRMQRSDKKGVFYYVCSGRHKDKTICNDYHYIKEEEIFDMLSKLFAKFATDERSGRAFYTFKYTFKEFYQMYIEKYLSDEELNKLPALEEKIKKLENRKSNLNIMLADGDIDKKEYRKLKQKTENELKELTTKQNMILNLKNEINKVWRTYQEFVKALENFDIDKSTNTELRKIIEKITILAKKDSSKEFVVDWNIDIKDLEL